VLHQYQQFLKTIMHSERQASINKVDHWTSHFAGLSHGPSTFAPYNPAQEPWVCPTVLSNPCLIPGRKFVFIIKKEKATVSSSFMSRDRFDHVVWSQSWAVICCAGLHFRVMSMAAAYYGVLGLVALVSQPTASLWQLEW
jgi:hypothetical protein